MDLLTTADKRQLVDLLCSLPGIDDSQVRDTLVADLPRNFQASLPHSNITRIDLIGMINMADSDTWRRLPDGTLPLAVIVENAISLVQGSGLVSNLQTLLDKVQTPATRPSGSPQTPTASSAMPFPQQRSIGPVLVAAGAGCVLLLLGLGVFLLNQGSDRGGGSNAAPSGSPVPAVTRTPGLGLTATVPPATLGNVPVATATPLLASQTLSTATLPVVVVPQPTFTAALAATASRPTPNVTLQAVLTETSGQVWSIAFDSAGDTLAWGGQDGHVQLSKPPGTLGLRLASGYHGDMRAVALTDDGTTLAASGDDKHVSLWHTGAGSTQASLPLPDYVRALALQPGTAHWLALGCDVLCKDQGGAVRLWDWRTTATPIAVGGHNDEVWGVAFDPRDSQWLASADKSGKVLLWQVTGDSIQQSRELAGPGLAVTSLAFSPDGRLLAAGAIDHKVYLWQAGDWDHFQTLEDSRITERVTSLAFAPGGSTLAAGYADNAVRLWDVAGRQLLRTLDESTDNIHSNVNAVAWSSQNLLAAGTLDGAVFLWHVH